MAVWRRADGEVPVALAVDGAAVAGFRVGYQRVRRPSTRMYGPSRGRGDWPDRLTPVDGPVPATDAAYFEVAVPLDAAPGLHRGALDVADRALPVELTVEDVALPPIDAAPRVWAYVDPRDLADAGVDPTAWARALRAYGVAASPDLGEDDWDTWAAAVRGLPAVPVALPDDAADEAAAIRTWVARLAGGPPPFAIPIDEPRALSTRALTRARAARVRAAGGGRFLFAVTDAPGPVYGDAVDVYVSPFAVTLAAPDPRRWTYNGTPPYAGAMILDTDATALRTWGWIGWRWQVPLWYAWEAAYWRDRYGARRRHADAALVDPDADAVTFDDGEDHGNLDGVLAWADGGRLVPTLRLEALRRGLEDRALLELLARCAGRADADAIAAPLVPAALGDAGGPGQSRAGAWPTDEAAWEAARGRLLDALAARSACQPDG